MKLVAAGRNSADQQPQLVYSGGGAEMYAQLERPQPIDEDVALTPVSDRPRRVQPDLSAESNSPNFVMTHDALASPAVPRKMTYRTPINRLSTRRYEALSSSAGSVTKPDHDDCLRRTSVVVQKHIATCEARRGRNQFRAEASRVFHEKNYASPRYKVTTYRLPLTWMGFQYTMHRADEHYEPPSTDDVYDFLSTLFVRAHLSSECSVVCLIYVERLMDKGKVSLLANTWRPILLCSMLLASKVWQDCASWNIEFNLVYPEYSLAAINALERNFVSALGWDMYITGSLYAKYYYALRSLNEKPDFRRRYNNFVIHTSNEQPKDAVNVQRRSDKLKDVWSRVLSQSL